MFSRLPRLAIAAALALSIGLHWGVLQSAAWLGMVVSYSQDAPLKEALAKTFDGKHPCPLCKAIAKGRRSEKESESAPAAKKLQFAYSLVPFAFVPPSDYRETCWPEVSAGGLSRTPPVPPPRGLRG